MNQDKSGATTKKNVDKTEQQANAIQINMLYFFLTSSISKMRTRRSSVWYPMHIHKVVSVSTSTHLNWPMFRLLFSWLFVWFMISCLFLTSSIDYGWAKCVSSSNDLLWIPIQTVNSHTKSFFSVAEIFLFIFTDSSWFFSVNLYSASFAVTIIVLSKEN